MKADDPNPYVMPTGAGSRIEQQRVRCSAAVFYWYSGVCCGVGSSAFVCVFVSNPRSGFYWWPFCAALSILAYLAAEWRQSRWRQEKC